MGAGPLSGRPTHTGVRNASKSATRWISSCPRKFDLTGGEIDRIDPRAVRQPLACVQCVDSPPGEIDILWPSSEMLHTAACGRGCVASRLLNVVAVRVPGRVGGGGVWVRIGAA